MTLENATQNLWKAHCNFYDPRKAINIVVDKIFNDHETAIEILMKANEEEISRHFNECEKHEAQLNAKDDEIERLKEHITHLQNVYMKLDGKYLKLKTELEELKDDK